MTAGGGGPRRAALLAGLALVAGFAAGRLWPGKAAIRGLVDASPPDLSRLDAPVRRAATATGVDPDLLRALVAVESGGDPRARSGAGAVGLVQLLPSTAAERAKALGLDPSAVDLTDPATNLLLGASHLARLLDTFCGEAAFALAAYNAGAAPVLRWRRRAVDAGAAEVVRREGYPETRHHVARALSWRDAYRAGR